MRGNRCILCCGERVLGNSLSIDRTQAVATLVAGKAATFRHNEMKKEENNEMARVGDEVKPRQDGQMNQWNGSRKRTFEILRKDKKERARGIPIRIGLLSKWLSDR